MEERNYTLHLGRIDDSLRIDDDDDADDNEKKRKKILKNLLV